MQCIYIFSLATFLDCVQLCTFVMRRSHWKIHSERHQTQTTHPPFHLSNIRRKPPPLSQEAGPDLSPNQASAVNISIIIVIIIVTIIIMSILNHHHPHQHLHHCDHDHSIVPGR